MGAIGTKSSPEPSAQVPQDSSCGLLGDAGWVAVSVPDLNGTLRSKALTRSSFVSSNQGAGLTITDLVLRTDVTDAPIAGGDDRLVGGDLTVVPDLSTLAVDPWRTDWATCLAFTQWRDGSRCDIAPRDVCATVLAELNEIGITIHAAFEYEFRLLERESGTAVTPSASYSHRLLSDLSGFADDLGRGTKGFAIDLETFHTEAGKGMVEVAVAARDGLRAADTAVLLRACVHHAAARHGLRATFAAKPVAGEEGSGGHLHLSLNDESGGNLFATDVLADNEMSEPLRYAIGGLLGHLGALSVFYNPHVNSYKRLISGWFAPTSADWAVDGRDAAVRVVLSRRPEATHLEFRRAGADANPYLVLAAAAASIADGLQRRLEAPTGTSLPAAPADLRLALAAFADDAAVRTRLGEPFCRHWEATRAWELHQFNETVTAWELQRVEA